MSAASHVAAIQPVCPGVPKVGQCLVWTSSGMHYELARYLSVLVGEAAPKKNPYAEQNYFCWWCLSIRLLEKLLRRNNAVLRQSLFQKSAIPSTVCALPDPEWSFLCFMGTQGSKARTYLRTLLNFTVHALSALLCCPSRVSISETEKSEKITCI